MLKVSRLLIAGIQSDQALVEAAIKQTIHKYKRSLQLEKWPQAYLQHIRVGPFDLSVKMEPAFFHHPCVNKSHYNEGMVVCMFDLIPTGISDSGYGYYSKHEAQSKFILEHFAILEEGIIGTLSHEIDHFLKESRKQTKDKDYKYLGPNVLWTSRTLIKDLGLESLGKPSEDLFPCLGGKQ